MPAPLSRRAAAKIALAGLALTALAACGDDDESTSSATSAAPTTPGPSATASAFPATVTSIYGTATIPSEPKRVVTIGFNEQDFALALGVTPVGIRQFTGGFAYKTRAWAKELLPATPLPEVGGTDLSIEAVAALEPDLILGSYSFITKTQYDQLSKIAPTVGDLVDSTKVGYAAATWQDQLDVVAKALGRTEQAETLKASVEKRFTDAAAAHPEFRGKVLGVNFGDPSTNGFYLLNGNDPRQDFFNQLGFTTPKTVDEISAENAAALDNDVLVNAGTTKAQALANPAFAALDVVKQGRTLYYGGFESEFLGALGFSSPLSLPYALDLVLPDLVAATDDDPATVVKAQR